MNTLALVLLSSLTCGPTPTPEAVATWDIPPWAAAGAELRGKITLPAQSAASDLPQGHYARPDRTTGTFDLTPVQGDPGRFQFALDAGPALGMLELSVAREAGVVPMAECRIPIGESVEIEITGEAAQALHFPLKGWPVDVVYVPCCTIYGGILKMLRFPENPVGVADGLVGTVASDFVMALPEELTRATAGLGLRFHATPGHSPRADSVGGESNAAPRLTVYRWNGTRWSEVIGLEWHSDDITFACADGGLYVLIQLP